MLVRVLFVLLAGVPVCRGPEGALGASYSGYYDPDGNSENADFYDSYNEEIKQPPERTTVIEILTRLKRNELDDIRRTLNPEEIIDVKGVLNNILQGNKPDSLKGQPSRHYTDSYYEYVEDFNNLEPEDRTTNGNDLKNWLPTVGDQKWSPAVEKRETLVATASQVKIKTWSFVYQPETSTYSDGDIIAEVRRIIPEGFVSRRSSINIQSLSPKQEVQTFSTTENTEESTIDIYPQETSTYSNSNMRAEVNKLVQHWSPADTKVNDIYPQETSTYSNSNMRAEVNKLVQHWSPADTKVNDIYPQETSTYSNSNMRAEVNKLVQHWSPADTKVNNIYPQETSTYSNSYMRAEVNKLVQHWSTADTKVNDIYPQETSTYSNSYMRAEVNKLVQHWSTADTKVNNIYPQETSTYSNSNMRAEVNKLVQHWSTADTKVNDIYPQETSTYSNSYMRAEVNKLVQHWSPADTKVNDQYPQETTTYSNLGIEAEVKKLVQHWTSKSKDLYPQETMTYSNLGIEAEVKKLVQHWTSKSKDLYPQETTTYSNLGIEAEVKKLVQHWTSKSKDLYPQETMTYSNLGIEAEVKKLVQHWTSKSKQETTNNNAAIQAEVRSLVQHWSPRTPSSSADPRSHRSNIQHGGNLSMMHQQSSGMQSEVRTLEPAGPVISSVHVQNWSPTDIARQRDPFDQNGDQRDPMENVQHQLRSDKDLVVTPVEVGHKPAVNIVHWSRTLSAEHWRSIAADDEETTLDTDNSTGILRAAETTTTEDATNTTTAVTTTETTTEIATTTPTTQPMDIDAIMAIISNLTYDYEWNLTEQFNKSIIDHGVPTCPWKGGGKWGPFGAWTATTVNLTTEFTWDFENSSVVSKCFVCGLKTPEIPHQAYCADAFAGDFLPLMPIDPRSRSMIASYRKYCRYIDVQNYIENPKEPRAIYGRFTGGCAVRWTDITGIYTQRTCRSRYRPLLGKHFASKRMAKLELALVNVENGCIISPMATLLPVSRGISLYARFHACVCNSNWCNRATLKNTSSNTFLTILLAHYLAHYS